MEQVINILFQEALYRTFTFAGSEGNTDTNVQQQYAWKNYAYEQQSQNAFYFGPNHHTLNILNKNHPTSSQKYIAILSVNPSWLQIDFNRGCKSSMGDDLWRIII